MDNNVNAEDLLLKIFHCMTELMEVKEFSKTVGILTELGRVLVNSDRASFWFWDREEKQCWTLAATGNVKIKIHEGTGIVGKTMFTDKAFLCNDPYEEPSFNRQVDERTGFVTKSILCLPVQDANGDVIGAFQAINKMNPDGSDGEFNQLDIERLALAVVFGGKTLESYLLQSESLTDKTTGLKNKNAFYEYYNSKIANIVWKTKTSLILCGIDNFDKIRKTCGDDMANAISKKITTLLKDSIGVDDLLAKWDNETFMILLIDRGISSTSRLTQAILDKACQTVDTREGIIKLTLSAGAHEIDTLFTLEENIKFVTDNYEDAKRLGGNRFV